MYTITLSCDTGVAFEGNDIIFYKDLLGSLGIPLRCFEVIVFFGRASEGPGGWAFCPVLDFSKWSSSWSWSKFGPILMKIGGEDTNGEGYMHTKKNFDRVKIVGFRS